MLMSPADFVKGILLGFFIGAIFMFLVAKDVIPLSFLGV